MTTAERATVYAVALGLLAAIATDLCATPGVTYLDATAGTASAVRDLAIADLIGFAAGVWTGILAALLHRT